MKALERIDAFKRLWSIAIPRLKPPSDEQILRWCVRFSDEVLEYALGRLQAKVRRGEISAEDNAGRYMSAVMLAEEKVSRSHSDIARIQRASLVKLGEERRQTEGVAR
jgi:hypothetical protein